MDSGTMDDREGTLAAARAIQPYLPDLVGPAADELGRQITELLAAASRGENVIEALRSLLARYETTADFVTEVLADAPHYRPPELQLSYWRTRSAAAKPPQLYWNTRFPDDKGILLNQPHLMVACAEYLLETALGPNAVPGAETNPQEAAGLLNRKIRYRLEAENGEFRLLNSAAWDIKAVSAPMTCTAAGTEAFRVIYRAGQVGQAIIKAFLIVDNGSVDQQQIELRVVSDGTAIGATPRTSATSSPGRSVGRSVNSALSPDYRFTIQRWLADLWHQNIQLVDVRPPPELADQLSWVANDLYRELREVSLACPLQGDPDRPLRLSNSDEGKLRLAKAGAELHHRLFREPIQPIERTVLERLGAIADRLSGVGNENDPLLLQIHASDYPLPWGLLYDRSADGGRDLRTADDVDPAGFWGRRFDIYRSVVSVDREAQRGGRRWVKPVIGAYVSRSQEQRDFVDELRANVSDALLEVDGTGSTADDLMDWAMSGKDSDLVYLFCHARPARYGGQNAGAATSWLGFGSSENDDEEGLRAGLDQLDRWWNEQRPTNPIVILNACSSGQQDLIYGAPFVDFFLEKWGAQAFIGADWPINASFADMFGRRMLRELLQNRRSLRDAFRAVSDEAAADSNYFPLMYAVYGLNTIQFIDPIDAG
jgi:CHAT domain